MRRGNDGTDGPLCVLMVTTTSWPLPCDETLLETLRERLGLEGVSVRPAGIGICGACTVLANGRPLSTCLLLTVLAEGLDVTTLEGLAGPDGTLASRAAGVSRPAGVPVRLLSRRA